MTCKITKSYKSLDTQWKKDMKDKGYIFKIIENSTLGIKPSERPKYFVLKNISSGKMQIQIFKSVYKGMLYGYNLKQIEVGKDGKIMEHYHKGENKE